MQEVSLFSVFRKIDNIIVKEIEDELLVITMNNGITDIDSSIYTINTTGKIIWEKLTGLISLDAIIEDLAGEYDVSREIIEKDVKKLIRDFLDKGLILEKE